jgi:HEAT repeat protein
MLEKLDTIDWSSLSHAYGAASNVPDLIRALASEDEEEREDAISKLYGIILHQGTVYEATAYAVPFLLELLEADTISGKADILGLLGAIAEGSSYLDAYQGMDLFSIERNSEGFSDKLAQELDFVRRAHAAILAGTPHFLSLLSNTSAETKMWSLYTLRTCIEQVVVIETTLWERFFIEKESRVKASLVLCLRDLWRYQITLPASAGVPSQTQIQRLVTVMRSPHESALVRFSAALSLIGWLNAEARDEAFARLQELAGASWEDFSSLLWNEMDSNIDTVTAGFAHLPELRLRFQLGLLQNPNLDIRTDAIYALGELCREQRSAALQVAPVLGELLGDPDSEVRVCAAGTLNELGSTAQPVTEKLLVALNDKNAGVRGNAAVALAKTGEKRAVPRIRELLKNAETANLALNALRILGPLASDAIGDLCTLLHRPANGLDTVNLLLALGEIDSTGESSVADVTAMLRSPVAGTAAWVLSTWGCAAQPAIPELLPLLNSPDELTRRNAVKALGNAGASTDGTTSELVSMLKAKDPLLRVYAAIALWQIRRSELTVPALMGIIEQALMNQSYDSQCACSLAAEYLGEIGGEASIACSVLLQALKHSSVYVGVHAACSLWQITGNTEDTLPVLLEGLKQFRGTKAIMDCLAAMGPLAKPAAPKLQHIIESEKRIPEFGSLDDQINQDEKIREMARQALKAILQQ